MFSDVSLGFPQSLQVNSWIVAYLEFGHDHFLLHTFQSSLGALYAEIPTAVLTELQKVNKICI
jgi:hypothetical protein